MCLWVMLVAVEWVIFGIKNLKLLKVYVNFYTILNETRTNLNKN